MKHNNLLISVVIPTLNTRPQFLQKALNSVEKQLYRPCEVIIVNNGRGAVELPDSSLHIRQFKTVYRAGVAQARNFGASLADGEYVAFLDDDDLWAPDYLENLKKRIVQEQPDCLVASLDQLVDGKTIAFKNADGLIHKDVILIRNPGITGSSVVVKKDAFLKIGGYNPKLPPSEDKSLIFELMQKGFNVVTVPESRAILRQHEKGDRLSDSKYMAEGIYQFYRIYKNQMNTGQKIYNLYKIFKYRQACSPSFINFCSRGIFLGLSVLFRIGRLI